MELYFGLPDMGNGTSSADFTVDSMPFTPGKYQIDMTKPTTAATSLHPRGSPSIDRARQLALLELRSVA